MSDLNKNSKLVKSLSENYGYTETEAIEGARNLMGFCNLLLKIDKRLRVEGNERYLKSIEENRNYCKSSSESK